MNSTTISANRKPLVRRLLKFIVDTHPPLPYAILTVLWSLSLMAILQRSAGSARFDAGMLLAPLSFFLVLLFLRAVDEIKDLEYDRKHKADRPLVSGEVSVGEVWGLAALVAAAVVGINLLVGQRLALFALANMSYGMFLFLLERGSRRFRESIVLNLVVTFPVSAALNVYAWLYLVERQQSPGAGMVAATIVAYMCAFLHFEFGRKLKWPHLARAGENGYAIVLGAGGAVVVCVLLGLTACGIISAIHLNNGATMLAWLPWLALIPSIAALAAFRKSRDKHRDLKPLFVLFLLVFFIGNVMAAVW